MNQVYREETAISFLHPPTAFEVLSPTEALKTLTTKCCM